MNIISWHLRLLLLICICSPYSLYAGEEYYWETTNPPGTTAWSTATGHSIYPSLLRNPDSLDVNDPLIITTPFSVDHAIVNIYSTMTNNSTMFLGENYYTSQHFGNGILNIVAGGQFINNSLLHSQSSYYYTADDQIEGAGIFTNNGTMTLTFMIYNNTGIFTNSLGASGTFSLSSSFSPGANSINDGALHITDLSTFTVPSLFTNASTGVLTLSSQSNSIAGSGELHNQGTISLQDTSSNSSVLINNGTLTITGPFTNTGTVTNNAGMSISSTGSLTNNATLNIASPITDVGDITNAGTVNVTGNQAIDAASFTSPGSQNYTITNHATFDSLTSSGTVDLSGGTVNVTSSFMGTPGASYSWDIITAPSITSVGTVINPPINTVNTTWSSNLSSTILQILLSVSGQMLVPLPGVDSEIAAVLANMANNITNAGQQALLDAVNSSATQDQYNYILNSLQPNTTTSTTTIAMQNIGFNRIETRIAHSGKNTQSATHKRHSKGHKRRITGFASGELTPDMAMWLSGFGSISKQHSRGDNQGYRAKILGTMIGIDTKTREDDIYGVALGISNANVDALNYADFTTRILGMNLMAYGSNQLTQNRFVEWIVSGAINKNHGIRVFGINGIDLSTTASYRGALVGAKVNVGRSYRLNNVLNITPVSTLQYVLVHQPSYDEDNSVAALHVSTKDNQSILTVGTGVRFNFWQDNSWIEGNRELRAMVTYDVLSPNQATTANFIVGSDAFIMNSAFARLALNLAADYGVTIYKNLDLQLSYNYEVRSGYYNNFGEIKLRYLF